MCVYGTVFPNVLVLYVLWEEGAHSLHWDLYSEIMPHQLTVLLLWVCVHVLIKKNQQQVCYSFYFMHAYTCSDSA